MAKSKRLIELMLAVNRRKQFTVKEMAVEFGVSPRTMHRDLQDLSELGMPLYSEFGPHGGYRLLKESVLPPIIFSESEAVAMFFAYQSLQYFAALPFESEAASALQKFYGYLPENTRSRIDNMKDRVAFWTPARTKGAPYLTLLLDAALEQKPVKVEYRSSEDTRTRIIQPVGIYSYNGYWYCPSYCYTKETFLLFRADRILAAGLAEGVQIAEAAGRLTIKEWLKHPFGEPPRTPKVLLHVLLTQKGVRRCEDHSEFGKAIKRRHDGNGILKTEIHRENIPFFAEYFLGLGADARVEAPEEMAAWIRDEVRKMQDVYDGKSF